jgi:hypothetical protein
VYESETVYDLGAGDLANSPLQMHQFFASRAEMHFFAGGISAFLHGQKTLGPQKYEASDVF